MGMGFALCHPGSIIVAVLVAAAQTKPRNLTQFVTLSPERSRVLAAGKFAPKWDV
jgi:hypothetical protein